MKKTFSILFLFVGALTVFEFIAIRGMFTWLIMCALAVVFGAINIVWELKDKEYISALRYLLTTVALCMGYCVIA